MYIDEDKYSIDQMIIFKDTTGNAELFFFKERERLLVMYKSYLDEYTTEDRINRPRTGGILPANAIDTTGIIHGDLRGILRDYIAWLLDRNPEVSKTLPWCNRHDNHFMNVGQYTLQLMSRRKNKDQTLELKWEDSEMLDMKANKFIVNGTRNIIIFNDFLYLPESSNLEE